MDRPEQKEIGFTKLDGTLDLRILLTTLMQKQLGMALDFARISGMSDRSFTQTARSMKDRSYEILGFGLKILEDSGYIKSDLNK